jgi:hypothetical protein
MNAKTLLLMLGVVAGTWSCSFSISSPSTPSQADQVATIVAATMQALTPTAGEPTSAPVVTQPGGEAVSYEYVSFVIPGGLASSAEGQTMTAVETNTSAPWDIAPSHLRFTLTGYPLQRTFHEPRIFVYPAEEYAQSNASAAEQIDRISKILGGTAPMVETLPSVPFFNAAPQIAAQIKIVPFGSGSGIRALTQYAQYAAPINNRELFYHFQGLTRDGSYYIIAILPINAAVLAEDEKTDAPVPEGGVPIPSDAGPNDLYYFSVTEKLNAIAPDDFSPSLNILDALIQSILVNTP